jgi:hypothetical protein
MVLIASAACALCAVLFLTIVVSTSTSAEADYYRGAYSHGGVHGPRGSAAYIGPRGVAVRGPYGGYGYRTAY